ncbi:hypothetical protein [Lentzea sp. NPDC051838]|uniref:hypothetical protein n=1 Tax=Lentzea sp. NPDC051838 TaxID=3154849 RepID=UPI003448EB1F
MNGWLLAAGITALGVAAIHIIGGHRDVVRPLLHAGLAEEPKRVLQAVWHMVSIDLVLSGIALTYLAFTSANELLAWFVAAHFVGYAGAFLAVTVSVRWPLFRLPQWVLLLPVAVLTLVGST